MDLKDVWFQIVKGVNTTTWFQICSLHIRTCVCRVTYPEAAVAAQREEGYRTVGAGGTLTHRLTHVA